MALLERESEAAALDAALQEARAGHGRVVLVAGEAGIGKTTLVADFLQRCGARAEILLGHCDPLITPNVFGPLHDVARHAGGALLAALEAELPRAQLFAAVLDHLQRRGRPTVLVLEDLHWADEATLDLVSFLARRIDASTALVVLTFRDDELGSDHKLRRVLGGIATLAAVRRIQLAPLSRAGVSRLIGDRRLDADTLHRATGGNPFFVGEIIAAPDRGVPPTVRDAVLARCARLPAAGRRLLEQLAVLGARIDQRILARLPGVDQDAFEQCLGAGIVRREGDGLAFRHELARTAVLDAMNPVQRRDCARVALEAAAAVGDGGGRGDLAQLAQYAEDAGDIDAAIAFGVKAAQAAAALGAHREAAAQYRRVARAATDRPPAERAVHAERLARATSLLDRLDEAVKAYREAVSLYDQAGDRLREGAAQAELAWVLVRAGMNAEAEAASHAAITLLEALPASRELAIAYRVQAHLRMLDRDRVPAESWGTKAIRLASSLGDLKTVAEAELVVGSALIAGGDDRGRVALDRCLAIARAQGLDPLVALTHSNAGSLYGETYRFAEAERELTTGLAFARSRDLDLATYYMNAWMALVRLYQGRWTEAEESASIVLADPGCAVISRIMALVALGRVRARRGEERAEPVLDEALALAERTGTLQRLAPVREARAERAWLAGDIDAARAEASAAYALALRHRHRWHVGEMAYWQHRAGTEVDVPRWAAAPFVQQCAGQWRQAAEAWKALDCPYEAARALGEGDVEAQQEALETFSALGAAPAAARLRQRLRQAGITTLPRGPRATTRENPLGLTARQMTILEALAAGLSNKEIAARLNLAPKTVDHHVSAVLEKLGVASRRDAIRIARDQGLIVRT